MHIERSGSWVEEDHVLLDLANAANRGLQHALDVYALLWVHHLVVALLELAVDVDVLNIELSQVLEDFIVHPGLDQLWIRVRAARAYLLAGFVLLCGNVLYFNL